MSKIKIQTTQNVTFDMSTATSGQRLGAAILDWIILFFYLFIISNIFEDIDYDFKSLNEVLRILLIYMPFYLYDPFMEYFNNGQTLGKMALRIKVLQANGSKPSLSSIVLRWLGRIFDFWIVFFLGAILFGSQGVEYVIGALMLNVFTGIAFPIIFIAVRNKGQRLGDVIANTVVVQMKNRVSLEDTILYLSKSGYEPVYSNVLRFNDRDMRIIKEALEHYKRSGSTEHVKELAIKAKELLGVDRKVKPVVFLQTILKDYNTLAIRNER